MMKRTTLLLLGALALTACGEDITPSPITTPQEGTLDLVLSAAEEGNGGMLLLISGGPVLALEPTEFDTFSLAADEGLRLFVVGTPAAGDVLARVVVPDVAAADRYSVTIEQVAGIADYAPRPTNAYTVKLVRQADPE